MENNEFVATLRELANFYEANPTIPHFWLYPEIYTNDKEVIKTFILATKDATKDYQDDTLYLKSDKTALQLKIPRENVCEKKIVARKFVEEIIVPGHVIPAHYEEIIEWECKGSLLENLGKEK